MKQLKLQGHQHLGYSPTWSWKIEEWIPLFTLKTSQLFPIINKFEFLKVALKILPKLVHSTHPASFCITLLLSLVLVHFLGCHLASELCVCYLVSWDYFIFPFHSCSTCVCSSHRFLTKCFLFLEDFQNPFRPDQVPRTPIAEHHVLNCNYNMFAGFDGYRPYPLECNLHLVKPPYHWLYL